MTQTSTAAPRHEANTFGERATHPSGVLMDLVVTLLAPMFLCVSSGDIGFARMAAIETVNAYRCRNRADLLSIAQIIGFGLAALGSLSLSMADDMSLAMTLRLRGNANACNRSAEQNRRALDRGYGETERWDEDVAEAADLPTAVTMGEDEVIAAVAAVRMLAAATQARLNTEAQPSANGPNAPAAATAKMTVAQQNQAIWGIGMADEAGRITASLTGLPRAQRRWASIQAATLSGAAHDLLTGVISVSQNQGPPASNQA